VDYYPSHLELRHRLERVAHFDPEVANGRLDTTVAEQQLHRPQVLRAERQRG
jgi:hypothetical protein